MLNVFTDNPGVARALQLVISRASLVALSVLVVHVGAILAYAQMTGTVIAPERAMVPLVWVAFAVWLVVHLHHRARRTGSNAMALAVGVGYFLLLAAIGGSIGLGTESSGLTIELATPGWGPIVLYGAAFVQVAVVPFELVGYLALSYGVYRAVAATSRGALAGLFGLFACIGCTLPLIAAVVSVFTGATVAIQPGSATYELATAVFVLTVVVLAAAIPTEGPRS